MMLVNKSGAAARVAIRNSSWSSSVIATSVAGISDVSHSSTHTSPFLRARRRSQSYGPTIIALRHYATKSSESPAEKVIERDVSAFLSKGLADAPIQDGLPRPVVPTSPLDNLSPSPLNQDITPPPTNEANIIREAIADFMAGYKVGDVLPPPEGVNGRLRRFWWHTKQLLKFYYRGLKALWPQYQMASALRKGVKDHGWVLNRREAVFLRRARSDILRLIPFTMILIISEEVLPLIVLYAPFILPSTCILPSQLTRIKAKEEEKRRKGLLQMLAYVQENAGQEGKLALDQLERPMILGLCKVMDLGAIAPQFWLQRRLRNHFEWLEEDDGRLRLENNGTDMTVEEKRLALAERGQHVLEEPSSKLQRRLDAWLSLQPAPLITAERTISERIWESYVKAVVAEAEQVPNLVKEQEARKGPKSD